LSFSVDQHPPEVHDSDDTFQMKLRSGNWIETVPDDVRSNPSASEKFRNLWTEVGNFSPLYNDKNYGSGESLVQNNGPHVTNGFTYQDILSRMMQGRPFSPVFGSVPSEKLPCRNEGSNDRVRTRSSSSSNSSGTNSSLFSTLKYDLTTDKSFNGIPKLTICKRRSSKTTPSSSIKPSTGGRALKTKRLKLIVGKESFHINLEK